MKKLAVPLFATLAAVGIAASLYLVFFVAPLEYSYNEAGKFNGSSLFFNQKIFYFHVGHAFWLFGAVFVSGISSIGFLITRDPRWDDVASASTDVAVAFGAVVLLTGSIWGKAAWDKWWDWDARLTTFLLLWLTMVGYVLVRKYGGHGSERMAAGLAVFATVNIPLVYFSVKIWRTLHPQTSVVPELEGGMRAAMWSSVGLFTIFYVLLLRLRIQAARSERRLTELRERALDAGLIE